MFFLIPLFIGMGLVGTGVAAIELTTWSIMTVVSLIATGASMILSGVSSLLKARHPSTTPSLAFDKGSNSVAVRQPAAPRVIAYGKNMLGGCFHSGPRCEKSP